MTRVAIALTGLLCAAAVLPAIGHDSWSRHGDVGKNPVVKSTDQRLDFSPKGRVVVENIGGSVDVRVGDSDKVEFTYERKAATQQDFDCETLEVQQDKAELRLVVRHKKTAECRVIRAEDGLTLRVPRGASLRLSSIGDSVKVDGVEGLVQLDAIGDSAILDGVEQVEARAVGDAVKIDVSRLGPQGIDISSVGDSVELSLPRGIDARLRIEGVGDSIRGPGLRLESPDDDYDAQLGKGGPRIRISSVGDSVHIKGPDLPRRDRKGHS